MGREVRRRRGQLHLRQTDMERRGGPSAGTMRNLEQANRTAYAPRTFVQLETALDWPDGVVERILDGTAEQSEIDEVVKRRYGPNERIPQEHTKSGGGAAVAAGSGAAQLGNLSAEARAEQLARLESGTHDIDRDLYKLASRLVELILERDPPLASGRAAMSPLFAMMQELAGLDDT